MFIKKLLLSNSSFESDIIGEIPLPANNLLDDIDDTPVPPYGTEITFAFQLPVFNTPILLTCVKSLDTLKIPVVYCIPDPNENPVFPILSSTYCLVAASPGYSGYAMFVNLAPPLSNFLYILMEL